jgi:hypothetical protein
MASIRVRQRKECKANSSVLWVHPGKHSSSSFNNHAEAVTFQDVLNPAFGIGRPRPVAVIAERDRDYPENRASGGRV